MPETRARAVQDLASLAGLKLGNYRLERLVGRGRMGVVYLAKDEALLRPTAIKVLSWSVADARGHDPVQWFLAEARLVARINHPRVVQIYGAARHGEYCYIAMEYVPGQSAEAMVARGAPLAPGLATDVLVQAASALHAAHGAGVVHRDVKPANLLVGAGGVTKLGDFGMALGPAEVRTASANLRCGTPYYTAPEIWRGEAASPASDVYSLGATYFHLLTGRPPFPDAEVAAVEQAHLAAPVPDPREVVPALPASCAALVRRALAKSPRERHASAQELLWEGRRVLQELTASPSASTPPAAPAREPAPPAAPMPPAAPALADGLGFVRQPFSDVDLAALPHLAAPLARARAEVLGWLEDGAAPALVLAAPDGSGAPVLCRALAAELGRSRRVLLAPAGAGAGARSLVQRIGAVLQAEDGVEDLEGLVARLADERRRRGAAPLLVVEGVCAADATRSGLASLVEASAWTRAFKLVLSGGPGLADELAAAGVGLAGDHAPEIRIAPLDRDGLARHLRGWLEATLSPLSPPVIVTPDALLLLELRSGGALERVNRIAENMLVLAAAERRRVLSSWHAWTASDAERWSERPTAPPRRPPRWPPAEVVDVIDACRRSAGMPPWPRAAPERR